MSSTQVSPKDGSAIVKKAGSASKYKKSLTLVALLTRFSQPMVLVYLN